MKEIAVRRCLRALAVGLGMAAACCPALLHGQRDDAAGGPPPSTAGVFPLSEVQRGMKATAWTVFAGTKPEPMDVEILGVLRGARGPGQDMILAQLHGAKAEYTGVVAGMSGSPVYIGNKLLGSLSYRIGQFSKDPIAGITPIEQMLDVLNMDSATPGPGDQAADAGGPRGQGKTPDGLDFQAMETPLVMSGFRPEAVKLWQEKMAGTGLDLVAAGGMGATSLPLTGDDPAPSAATLAGVTPGSAVSMQLVRGDLEIAATCTVTYIAAKQLLACGHPVLQAGPVSLPMTAAEVVTTLASPLNAFKIVNTGETIGAFTEDRDSAIRGVIGRKARMIPVRIALDGPGRATGRVLHLEVLDSPSLTAQALVVSLYSSLLESNDSTAETSYHLTGSIDLEGGEGAPIDLWVSSGGFMGAALEAALAVGERFTKIYSNGTRQGAVRGVSLHVEAIPRRVQVQLETAKLVSGDIVHAGDTVTVEATVRPWQQAARNIRIPVKIPARLGAGNVRILVSDAGILDRTLVQPRFSGRAADLAAELALARGSHPADRIYVSLLVGETQAGMAGQTLTGLPLSVANALEPMRSAQDVSLNGESAEVAAEAQAGGVLSGFQILNMHIEAGGGLN